MNAISASSHSRTEPLQIEALDLMPLLTTLPPKIDFVLPGFVTQTVGALVAPGAAGKSLLALQVALSMTSGEDLLGLGSITEGKVIYLSAEDPPLALKHRFHALGALMKDKNSWVKASERLEVFPLAGMSCDLFEQAFRDSLTSLSKGCRLVIFDTLRRFHTRDENSSSDMARLLGVLEELAAVSGASVLFLHHTNKSSANGGTGDEQQAARGSSVLTDNARWQSYLVTMTPANAKAFDIDPDVRSFFVRFGIAKQNYAPPFRERWYRRGRGGVLLPVSVDELQEEARKLSAETASGAVSRGRSNQKARHGSL